LEIKLQKKTEDCWWCVYKAASKLRIDWSV